MRFLVLYVLALSIAVGIAVVFPTERAFVGNVGVLVIGALLGILPVFIIDEINRARSARNVATALFHELAKWSVVAGRHPWNARQTCCGAAKAHP